MSWWNVRSRILFKQSVSRGTSANVCFWASFKSFSIRGLMPYLSSQFHAMILTLFTQFLPCPVIVPKNANEPLLSIGLAIITYELNEAIIFDFLVNN